MSVRTTAKDPADQKYFDFLCDLRDSGVTNMWGASPYLARQFKLLESQASEIFFRWINSFDEVTA